MSSLLNTIIVKHCHFPSCLFIFWWCFIINPDQDAGFNRNIYALGSVANPLELDMDGLWRLLGLSLTLKWIIPSFPTQHQSGFGGYDFILIHGLYTGKSPTCPDTAALRCWCPSPWNARATFMAPSAIWIAVWVACPRNWETRSFNITSTCGGVSSNL